MTAHRTFEDFKRTVRALARHFKTDTVVIVGSQAILAIPELRDLDVASQEVDAYPRNYRLWEASVSGQTASEEVNALFGYMSQFHETHKFYIDGVDETTAILPEGWWDRRVVTDVECDGRIVFAVTPEIHDLAISKLVRLERRDEEFVMKLAGRGVLKLETIRDRANLLAPEFSTQKAEVLAIVEDLVFQ
jgi:hypothetical protein